MIIRKRAWRSISGAYFRAESEMTAWFAQELFCRPATRSIFSPSPFLLIPKALLGTPHVNRLKT